jgi:GNAT superfamily N-acetyltransferase
MKLRSLGFQTDLIFVRFDGKVTDRDDYLVAETPENPTYYWGNFIIFKRAPQLGDFARWREIFDREFAHAPRVRHMAVAWDDPEGELGYLQPFMDSGFELEAGVVLTASQLKPPPQAKIEVEIRPISTDQEWKDAIACQVATRNPDQTIPEYTDFVQARLGRMRRMVAAGRGQWFGAFFKGKLVADLGIFKEGTLARYQSVGTLPDFQRQGIAGTLVAQAGQFAFEKMGVERLIIVADQGHHAEKLYRSIGFSETEKMVGIHVRVR